MTDARSPSADFLRRAPLNLDDEAIAWVTDTAASLDQQAQLMQLFVIGMHGPAGSWNGDAIKRLRPGGEAGRIEQGRPVQAKVFGQMESYDPATDSWQHHAPMPTPRHAVGAALIGDWIYVAGGGAVLGGGVQSAVHEAFTLG